MSADEECPEAKRRRVDSSLSESEENTENYNTNESANLHDQLRQFDVLDEVQGDESGSDDYGGMLIVCVVTLSHKIAVANNIFFILHN